jgi:succinyl-diaminopimelate desuccinylase
MDKNSLVSQLKKLVEMRTLPGEMEVNKKALDYVLSLVDKRVIVDRFVNGKAEVMTLSVNGTKNPEICYMVHMDVVAGRDDQFEMVEDGDKLVGRGTCDMKFSIPIGIALLNEAIEKKIDFSMVITTDEEIGGLEGAKILSEQKGFAPKMLIVPDGGENLNFVDKAKGVCQLNIIAKGVPAHASRPWLGKNALASMTDLAHLLNEKYRENNRTEGWVTTMNIGTLNGGISTNQVCPLAEMKIDFRYPESDSIEKLIDQVKEMASEVEGDFEINTLSTGLPTFTDINDDRVKRYIKIMSETFGKEIMVKPTYGASDARHFASLNIPVLMHKPLGGEIHSDNEWISVSSTMLFYEGLRNYLGLK